MKLKRLAAPARIALALVSLQPDSRAQITEIIDETGDGAGTPSSKPLASRWLRTARSSPPG